MNKHKNEHRQQYSGINSFMIFDVSGAFAIHRHAGKPSQDLEGETDSEFNNLQTVDDSDNKGSLKWRGLIVFAFRRHLFREVS